MKNKIKKQAQGLLEYGIIAAILAIVCVSIASSMGTATSNTLNNGEGSVANYIDTTILAAAPNPGTKTLADCELDDEDCITKACTYEAEGGWLKDGENKPDDCSNYF